MTNDSDLAAKGDREAILRLTYGHVCGERDRLRNARAGFALALGPLPASAGISTALVATFDQSRDLVWLVLAIASLLALVLAGILSAGQLAYRHLYAREISSLRVQLGDAYPELLRELDSTEPRWLDTRTEIEDLLPSEEWFSAMIALERKIYGSQKPPPEGSLWKLGLWQLRSPFKRVHNLQEGLESERSAVFVVQLLWLLVIVFLVLSVLD